MKTLTRKQKRKFRVRNKIEGTSNRPRLSIQRSNKHIYAQLIDDVNHKTLCSVSDVNLKKNGTGVEKAHKVGELIAKKAKSLNIENVIFDRGSSLYHGRVKALAEGARSAGLIF